MKFDQLYTLDTGKSGFKTIVIDFPEQHPLGKYSNGYEVSQMQYRTSCGGEVFPMHCAPCNQYIVYLSGEVEITTSSGEHRVFRAGDILYVTDTSGEGHMTHVLTPGHSLIIKETTK